ncbi:MAG TPA: hypothetical protein PKI34_03735, partial [Bacteroidales bacterium]|nr:hypothetical protein [Bacteroidales bacterium]
MKKLRSVIIAILGLMICLTGVPVKSQAPQSFKYQAVVRDRAGQVLPSQDINLQISILQSNTEGPEAYREMHSVTTSELGMVNIEVGKGKSLAGSFTAIDWSAGNHYLRIEMDPAGGTNFELMGFSQLLSVPYALYADRAGSGERGNDFDWQILGPDVVTGHGGDYPGGYVGVGNNAPQTLLYVAKNMGEPTITIRNLGGGGGATYSMIDDLSGANWKFKATTYGGFKIRDQAWGLDVLTMEPNSAANALYINNLGHVGLGTTTPIEKLSIENGDMYMRDSYPFIFLNNISRGGHTGITFRQNDDYRAWLYFDDYDGLLRLNAEAGGGWRNDLVITSAGKIGIGTPSPEGTFHVSESVSDYTAIFGSDIATFTYGTDVNIGDDNARALLYIGQSYDYKGFNIWAYNATPSNAFYHIGTFQGANPLVFQAEGAIGGKVGIGTTAPQALFHVAQQSSSYTAAFGTPVSTWTSSTNVTIGDDNATTAFYIGQSDDNKGFCNWHYNSTPAGAFYSVGTYAGLNPLILQNAGGNVGIGTQSPASRLHVKFASTDDIYLGYDTEYPAYIYHNETESDGDGQAAIYTYRTRDSRNDGTGYENYSINSAMKGYSFYGDKYSFGTGGFNWNDFTRCGGVIGAEYFGYYWGALGYKTSGSSTYGGYF